MLRFVQLLPHDPDKDHRGDCFRTAIACILETPPAEVPHFVESETWFMDCQKWLRNRGYCLVYEANPTYAEYWGYHLISGDGPRGMRHTVVGCGGEEVWDPHPSGDGLKPGGDRVYSLLAPIDPVNFPPKFSEILRHHRQPDGVL